MPKGMATKDAVQGIEEVSVEEEVDSIITMAVERCGDHLVGVSSIPAKISTLCSNIKEVEEIPIDFQPEVIDTTKTRQEIWALFREEVKKGLEKKRRERTNSVDNHGTW